MKRSEIKSFIESGVNELNPELPFGTGRISEFNSKRDNEYPTVWLETLESTTDITVGQQLPIDDYPIKLHIVKKDSIDSSPEQYEQLIDECDEIAQKLIKKYNAVVEDYHLITISGISRKPFIKQHADCLTGVLLSFDLNVPDTTNVC